MSDRVLREVPPPIGLPAIVVAAGESRRMGRLKPLLPLGDRTILQHVVDSLLSAGCGPVIVVVGHRGDEVGRIVADRPVIVQRNELYRDGMLSSVKCGAGHLPDGSKAFFVALGDQPDIPEVVLRGLAQAWNSVPGGVLLPNYSGRRGHPILIDCDLIPHLMQLPRTGTLRDLVFSPQVRRREIDVPDFSLPVDLDTPEEYAEAERSGRFARQSSEVSLKQTGEI